MGATTLRSAQGSYPLPLRSDSNTKCVPTVISKSPDELKDGPQVPLIV